MFYGGEELDVGQLSAIYKVAHPIFMRFRLRNERQLFHFNSLGYCPDLVRFVEIQQQKVSNNEFQKVSFKPMGVSNYTKS